VHPASAPVQNHQDLPLLGRNGNSVPEAWRFSGRISVLPATEKRALLFDYTSVENVSSSSTASLSPETFRQRLPVFSILPPCLPREVIAAARIIDRLVRSLYNLAWASPDDHPVPFARQRQRSGNSKIGAYPTLKSDRKQKDDLAGTVGGSRLWLRVKKAIATRPRKKNSEPTKSDRASAYTGPASHIFSLAKRGPVRNLMVQD
jgi:hypothetical protein